MGLLDVQEREQPLEYAVDDPKRIHHTQQLEVRLHVQRVCIFKF
jgi:hypothetical protein